MNYLKFARDITRAEASRYTGAEGAVITTDVMYCEGCDDEKPATLFTLDPDAERCDECIEAMPTYDELEADKGDIRDHQMRDGD